MVFFSHSIAGNHTVTQSSFETPCQPLEGGFNSGYVYILENTTTSNLPLWNLTITDDSKRKYYPYPHPVLRVRIQSIN